MLAVVGAAEASVFFVGAKAGKLIIQSSLGLGRLEIPLWELWRLCIALLCWRRLGIGSPLLIVRLLLLKFLVSFDCGG